MAGARSAQAPPPPPTHEEKHMNRKQLVAEAATVTGLPQNAVNAVTTAILDAITSAVANGDKVQLTGFGSFEQVHKPARDGRNPSTGEPIRIEAKNVPAFKPGIEFKATVAEGGRVTVAA
ncbi:MULTISPECIES: HU family DNA-binding protein [unclassified Microbispora]|uniref:HU family DNA-binding protein n=1 Tax=unclassified Microbispora TaxID=2614687 RepID=UPI0021B00A3D|nr:HU family DNA-binding protein [Microbispora sp. SCL1-1]